jgi:carbon monoxide dehydrogenase subunit G
VLIESEFEVGAPVDKVWAFFQDVPALAPCLPGAEITEVIDADNYKGMVTSKVGPVKLKFGGTAYIAERDAANRRIVIQAAGGEAGGKGQAEMNITAVLVSSGRGTKVKVKQDLVLSGAIAQYGRGMVADIMNVIMKSFATSVERNIEARERGQGPVAGASSVGGIGVAISAAKLALKRVVGRLIGKSAWYS